MSRSSTGLESNVAGLLCYVLGWLTGLIFILIERQDDFVRFHAMQAIITFGGLTVLMIVLGLIPFIGPLLGLLGFVLWILLMVKAFQGERFKLPAIGDLAETWAKKI